MTCHSTTCCRRYRQGFEFRATPSFPTGAWLCTDQHQPSPPTQLSLFFAEDMVWLEGTFNRLKQQSPAAVSMVFSLYLFRRAPCPMRLPTSSTPVFLIVALLADFVQDGLPKPRCWHQLSVHSFCKACCDTE
jgi:hypothetical protein